MIFIYEELIDEKELDINIKEYYDECIKELRKIIKKDKDTATTKKQLYEIYDKIIGEETISTIEELKLLKEKSNYNDLKNTIFVKSLKIEYLKKEMKKLNKLSEIKSYKNNKFRYYPNIQEYTKYDTFLRELSKKKEFAIHYIPKTRKNSCIKEIFTLSPHQLFLKNYMSPKTPYNSILIFHGVGVGKTCSGVSIAENFKDLLEKAIVLAPEKIQTGWNKNIFDPRKESNQCTQDNYIQGEDIFEKNKEKLAKKRIKEYYEMFGYLSFANSVKKYLEENTKMIPKTDIISIKQKEIELIKDKYSNRVLIIDEVHKIRSEDSLIKERDTILYIEKVIKYSDNLKLILLTANPMFNQPEEIIWILNMMLLNDKREIIKDKINFDEQNNLTKESEDIIKYYSRGYISYLRGENPTTFPYRINISQIKGEEKKILGQKNRTIFNTENSNRDMKFMELYASKLNGKQLKTYLNEIKLIENKETISDVTYYGKMLQISNCIFPVDSEDVDDCYGTNGLRNCFTIKNKKPVKYTLKKRIKNFLDLDELGEYACKIKTIIENIIDSDGITFIYSNYLDGGIMPLVLALEQNGFTKYDKEEVLVSPKKRKPISYDGKPLKEDGYKACYSVIAGGSLKLTNNFEGELNVLNSEENKQGQLIKVVIGSTVAAEGLDFKNIRNIHLLEPWYNINKLEQVIGRGIRNCSHAMLEDKFKNVTIFLHSCDIKNNESIETYMYHSCEDKATQIGYIEKILKEVSIDKYLFQNSNIIKESDIDSIEIKPSKKGQNEFQDKPFDKPYSRTCSFLEKCDYIEDKFSIVENVKNDKLEESTFSIEYSQPIADTYKKYISEILKEFICLNYDELENKMKYIFENFNSDILNHSLEQMITDKYTIIKNKTKGYINYLNGYYVFQPVKNEDIYLTSYYRVNSGKINKSDYRLEMDNYIFLDIEQRQSYGDTELEYLISKIDTSNKYLSNNAKIKVNWENLNDIFGTEKDKLIYSFIIDRYSFKDRCKLLYFLLVQLNGNVNIKEKKIEEKFKKKFEKLNNIFKREKDKFKLFNEIISPLFIYQDKNTGEYLWSHKYTNKHDIWGCMIYYHERNELIMFRYDREELELILCNNVLNENIKESFKNMKFKSVDIGTMYGTLEYKENTYQKEIFRNIPLKHKRDEDPDGKIVLSSAWKELSPEALGDYIKVHQKQFNLNNDKYKKLIQYVTNKRPEEYDEEKMKENIDKIKITFMLELLLRNSGKFIKGDIISLYKDLKINLI